MHGSAILFCKIKRVLSFCLSRVFTDSVLRPHSHCSSLLMAHHLGADTVCRHTATHHTKKRYMVLLRTGFDEEHLRSLRAKRLHPIVIPLR